MKKNLFSLMLFFFTFQFAQAQQFNPSLSKSYSKAELVKIEQENPNQLKVLDYAIANACYYINKPEGKNVEYPVINTKNHSTNFTELELKITDRTQYFTAKESGKLLVVKSLYVLELEMKNK
jgi:hypothetical protein